MEGKPPLETDYQVRVGSYISSLQAELAVVKEQRKAVSQQMGELAVQRDDLHGQEFSLQWRIGQARIACSKEEPQPDSFVLNRTAEELRAGWGDSERLVDPPLV